jgi:hypothetical protein
LRDTAQFLSFLFCYSVFPSLLICLGGKNLRLVALATRHVFGINMKNLFAGRRARISGGSGITIRRLVQYSLRGCFGSSRRFASYRVGRILTEGTKCHYAWHSTCQLQSCRRYTRFIRTWSHVIAIAAYLRTRKILGG